MQKKMHALGEEEDLHLPLPSHAALLQVKVNPASALPCQLTRYSLYS
jgi:hypothetical protein